MLWSLFISTAFAQTTAPAAAAPGPSTLETLLPFAIMIGVMYFVFIRPQAKRQKEHQQFLNEVKRGDEVVTASGIFGRIEGLTDTMVTLEVADGVRIKFLRTQIAGSQKAATAQNNEGKK